MEEKLKKVFAAVAGEDLEIDAYELRDVLNATFKKGAARNLLLFSCEYQASIASTLSSSMILIVKHIHISL